MKKILYIINNPTQDWKTLIPAQGVDSTCVMVKRDFDSESIPVSKKYLLDSSTTDGDDNSQTISYQKFLEEIFSSDLPVVL